LVVVLDEVEVNIFSDGGFNVTISSAGILALMEIGSLRSMSYNVIRNLLSQSIIEVNKPLFSCSSFQGSTVLPVSVSSVEVVVQHELT